MKKQCTFDHQPTDTEGSLSLKKILRTSSGGLEFIKYSHNLIRKTFDEISSQFLSDIYDDLA